MTGRATARALLERRAELLRARPAADSAAGAELAELTERLREELWAEPPVVRPLAPDDPLVADLGAREPVNPPEDHDDLARRVAPDRRLFVLSTADEPDRPVNVVWVALTRGVPSRLDQVVGAGLPLLDPAAADTAVFYSIWNADPALDGLGRGTTLLERSIDLLGGEFPALRTYVTLSPVPGLRRWMDDGPAGTVPNDAAVERAAARYLTSLREDGRPLDAVARFHLGNGARLWRLNPGADPSPLGMERSWGLMANYRYAPEDRAANRAALAAGRVVTGEVSNG
ncbi:MAG: malonyl-CoA decarboxylase domain-containing protein [Microthrixaceae bacterium]